MNPTAARNTSARRRAREKAGASVRALTLDELYARDRGVCLRCGVRIPRSKATKDHRVPLSRGGRDTPSNSVLMCRSHNSAKGARTEREIAKADARPGLKRKAFRRTPPTLADKSEAARKRQAREFDQGRAPMTFADEVPDDELF